MFPSRATSRQNSDLGLVALQRDREHDVPKPRDLPAELLVDEARVGEDVELAVPMCLGEAKHVTLAHQRLPARQHVEMAAELRALGHETVHVLVRQVEQVAVIRCPAANAVLVACACRVKKDDPRDVAVVAAGIHHRRAQPPERRLVACVQQERAQHVRVALVDDVKQPLLPLGPWMQGGAYAVNGVGNGIF